MEQNPKESLHRQEPVPQFLRYKSRLYKLTDELVVASQVVDLDCGLDCQTEQTESQSLPEETKQLAKSQDGTQLAMAGHGRSPAGNLSHSQMIVELKSELERSLQASEREMSQRLIFLIKSVQNSQEYELDASEKVQNWLRVIMSLILLLSLIFLVLFFFGDDIYKTYHSQIAELNHEQLICREEYLQHECDRLEVEPVLVQYCNNWKKCYSADVTQKVKKTESLSIWITENINAVFRHLSYESYIGILALSAGFVFIMALMSCLFSICGGRKRG